MTTISKERLEEILARVKVATGGDDQLDIDLTEVFVSSREADIHRRFSIGIYRFSHSIDAVTGLVERMLPGRKWGVASITVKTGEKSHEGYPRYGEGFRAHVVKNSPLRPMPNIADGPTAALALIAALLSALLKDATNVG